jgi:hypothetical protein
MEDHDRKYVISCLESLFSKVSREIGAENVKDVGLEYMCLGSNYHGMFFVPKSLQTMIQNITSLHNVSDPFERPEGKEMVKMFIDHLVAGCNMRVTVNGREGIQIQETLYHENTYFWVQCEKFIEECLLCLQTDILGCVGKIQLKLEELESYEVKGRSRVSREIYQRQKARLEIIERILKALIDVPSFFESFVIPQQVQEFDAMDKEFEKQCKNKHID